MRCERGMARRCVAKQVVGWGAPWARERTPPSCVGRYRIAARSSLRSRSHFTFCSIKTTNTIMNFHFNQNCPVVDHASTVCGCAGCHSCPVPMLRARPAGVRAHHTTGATPRGLFRQLPPPARDPTRPHSTPDSGTEGASHCERRGIKELSQSDEALCRISQPRVARYGALILRAGRGGWHWRALGRGHRSFVWKRLI